METVELIIKVSITLFNAVALGFVLIMVSRWHRRMEDKLRRMVNDGMKSKDIAYEMGVAASTISTYIRKYGLRDKG